MISNKEIGLVTEILLMAIVIFVILLFLGIGMLVIVHVCIVGRAITTEPETNSATDQTANQGRSNTTTMISINDLEKLPCYDYMEKGSSPVDCAVCLENFKLGDKIRLLPICRHSFHAQCVDAWLLKTPVCPICRTSTADDSRRFGVDYLGEESSHFSDITSMTGSQLTEATTSSSSSRHFSDISVEIQGSNNGIEMLRENQAGESMNQLRNASVESEERQIAVVGTELSSNPSLSLHAAIEVELPV